MTEIKRRVSVCMENVHDHKGFTIPEMVFCLFVLTIIVHSMPFVFKQIIQYHQLEPTVDIQVYQFFHHLNDELYESNFVKPIQNGVQLQTQQGDLIDIEQYGSIIRRQVNGLGNEWLLQGVQNMSIEVTQDFLIINIIMKNGEAYEKIFRPYPI